MIRIVFCLGILAVLSGIIPHTASCNTSNTQQQPDRVTTSKNPQSPSPSSSPPTTAVHELCLGHIPCYKDQLEKIVKEHGTALALQLINQVVEKDRVALREAHNLTHHVGRYAYQYFKDVTAVMSQCTPAHQSGCYHGALEAFLSSQSHIKPEAVVSICDPKLEKEKGRFAYFNCFHGLGHGLTMHLNHDLKKALTLCDTLQTAWDRESCYGGVFMETVVTGIRGFHRHRAHGQQQHAGSHPQLLDPENLLYPCTDVEIRYWRECYMMQTSIILHFTKNNFEKAFRVCDEAPSNMRPICYQSMGRDISGHTLRDSHRSIALCKLGTAAYQSRCFIGVVKNFLNVKGESSAEAFEFCQQTPEQHKTDCYFAIGEELLVLYAQPTQRIVECDQAETPHIQDCRRGARLPRKPS